MMNDAPSSTAVGLAMPTAIDTRFGRFAVSANDAIDFPLGVPGFEQCRHFVLVQGPDVAPFQVLHALEGPGASFLVIDPRLTLPQYRSVLSQTDLMRLGANESSLLLWLAIVTLDQDERAFVNLRAPIVVNPERMLGYQVMPHNSLYPLRHLLASE
jgi:flagellar assembly factor FliW